MPKKTPQRMCLGCREMKPKSELIRVVKSPKDEISMDISGKKPGRGAYICRDANCFKRVAKSNALSRTFGAPIPQSVTDSLQEQLNG